MIVAAGLWFTAAIGDRYIPARDHITVTIEERFHESGSRAPGTYGVYARLPDGSRQPVHSDVLYDRFENYGAVPAQTTGWFGRVIAVTIDGQTISVGQTLKFQLFFAIPCIGFLLIIVVRMIRNGPRVVINDVIDPD